MNLKDVLIVDDDVLFRWALQKELQARRLDTRISGTGMECLEAVKEKHYDLLFLDIHLPDANGLDLLETIRAGSPKTRVVVVSGDGSLENRRKAFSAGAEQFLEKPFDIGALMRLLASASWGGECRRNHARYLCRFPLKFSVLSPLPGEEQFFIGSIDGSVEDIGQGGLRLATEYPYPLRAGQEVRLMVRPDADPFSGMLPPGGCAEIVWAVTSGETTAAGLRFLPDRTFPA